MRHLRVVAFVVLLAAAQAHAEEVSLRQQSGLKTWFRQNRIDLERLDFTFDRIVVEANGRRWLCGVVRGRSRYGGYAGQQHFAAILDDDDRTRMAWTAEYGTEEWESHIAPRCGR